MNNKLSKLSQFVLLTVCTFFLSLNIQAQKNYSEGYIIMADGEKVTGLIDYKNWNINPKLINFKKTEGSPRQSYSPLDISSFGVEDEVYDGAIVETCINTTNLQRLTENPKPDLVLDTVFLQTIIQGDKGLYYVKNFYGVENFYLKTDDKYELLIYKQYIKKFNNIRNKAENKKYVGQLNFQLQDCPKTNAFLEGISYTKKSLKRLFVNYYNCIDSDIEFQKKSEKVLKNFGVFAGPSHTRLEFQGILRYEGIDFDPSIDYAIGMSFEFVFKRLQRKWSLQNELSTATFKFENEYTDFVNEDYYTKYTTEFGFSYIKLTNLLRFKYPVKNTFIFLNAGISNGLALGFVNREKRELKFYTDESTQVTAFIPDARKHEQSFVLGAGAIYKKFSFEFRYEQGNGMSPIATLKSSTKRLYGLVGYKF